jgi:hypothetical protein
MTWDNNDAAIELKLSIYSFQIFSDLDQRLEVPYLKPQIESRSFPT